MLLRKVFVLVLLGVLASSALAASVVLVSPRSLTLSSQESVELGAVAPGETLSLFFDYRAGDGVFWETVQVDTASLASGWTVAPVMRFAESFEVQITVSPTETERRETIVLVFESEGVSERVSFELLVRNDLLRIELVSPDPQMLQGNEAVYTLRVLNESLASHIVEVDSALPRQIFEPFSFEAASRYLEPSTVEKTFSVTPQAYGRQSVSFRVKSGLNQKTFSVFNESLQVQPVWRSKFENGLFSFPVLLPNLNAFYFLNALFSFGF